MIEFETFITERIKKQEQENKRACKLMLENLEAEDKIHEFCVKGFLVSMIIVLPIIYFVCKHYQ